MPFWYIPPCLRQCSDEQERRQRLAKVGIFLHTHVHPALVHLCILLHTGIGCSHSEGKDGGGRDDDDELSAITRPPKLPQNDAVHSASYKGGHGLCLGRGGEIGTRYQGLGAQDIFGSLLYAAVLQYIYRSKSYYFSLYLEL